ncbi:hypothetical protein JYU34_012314 [Plutella xylostella]|uniref:Uncharacterized protein n=1 Tax=Plutella xylostella TaxID=51655 RepID=A0ABQ7QEW1_PLUXY|nr:hypothetical protein JYU34_012314 [Plutella xylostella]
MEYLQHKDSGGTEGGANLSRNCSVREGGKALIVDSLKADLNLLIFAHTSEGFTWGDMERQKDRQLANFFCLNNCLVLVIVSGGVDENFEVNLIKIGKWSLPKVEGRGVQSSSAANLGEQIDRSGALMPWPGAVLRVAEPLFNITRLYLSTNSKIFTEQGVGVEAIVLPQEECWQLRSPKIKRGLGIEDRRPSISLMISEEARGIYKETKVMLLTFTAIMEKLLLWDGMGICT